MAADLLSRRTLVAALILLTGIATTFAGEVQVTWDPSQGATGYRVYHGTVSGQYTGPLDVGNTTNTTLALDDCTLWYVAATAYNASGESGYSIERSTWPRAVLASASPNSAEQGSQVDIIVTGVNFRAGDVLTLSNPGVQIDAASIDSCHQMTLTLTVANDAPTGAVDLTVTHPSGVIGTGAALFTIDLMSDVTGPVITGLQATQVDGTSAVISWTTDEPANGTVFYRAEGDTPYVAVSGDGSVTEHSVALTGLTPETTYEFHVSSTDAADNTTTTSPDENFTTDASSYEYIRFEAEAGVLTNPIDAVTGTGAFDGAWIDTPPSSSQGSAADPMGTATFGVNLPTGGTWYVWVRMYAPGGSANSWFESIDGAERVMISTNVFSEWTWVAGTAYDLDAGLHAVELGGREPETRVDRVLLTDDPDFVPTEQPGADITPPGAVEDLSAVANGAQIDLSWTNPADGDLTTVVIRYRTDAFYPTSPADGLPLVDEPAQPGSSESHAHQGVDPGMTYYYSAFAVDGAGNVSPAVHALGAIASVPPPPQNVDVY